MKVSPGLRAVLYLTFLLLAATGGVWLWLGEDGAPGTRAGAMKLHGLLASGSLVLLGTFLASHVPTGLRARKRTPSGVSLLAIYLLLAGTGYLLYYAGGERLRELSSDAHVAGGVLSILAIALHARPFGGRRTDGGDRSRSSSESEPARAERTIARRRLAPPRRPVPANQGRTPTT